MGILIDKGAVAILNKAISRYGKLHDLHIDRKGRVITGSLLPVGETEPISIKALYDINTDKFKMTITSAETSREWLTLLLGDFVLPRSFDVPVWLRPLILDKD